MKKKHEFLSLVACGMPLINYCYVFLFWLAASASLGHWARPGLNDPKGFFFGIPAALEVILMLFSFSVLPLVLYLGYRHRKIVIYTVIYFACLIVGIALFRMDILQITTWIAD